MARGEVTRLLHAHASGKGDAINELLPIVYEELRELARSQLRGESVGHTLGASALVHEAYLRLANRRELRPRDRHHFFAIAAQSMRRVLVDHARARRMQKRGGDVHQRALP